MDPLKDLHNFLLAAVKGICDDQDQVSVDSTKSGRTVTLIVHCANEDLRFVYAKLTHIRQLAIAIACRNKAQVNIVIDDRQSGCYLEV